MRYHLITVSMAIIKIKITSSGEGMEKREPWCSVDGNVNCYRHYGKQHGVSSKKLRTELPYDSAIPLLGMCPDKTII